MLERHRAWFLTVNRQFRYRKHIHHNHQLQFLHHDVEIEAGDYDVYVYDSETDDLLLETTLYDVQASDVINL